MIRLLSAVVVVSSLSAPSAAFRLSSLPLAYRSRALSAVSNTPAALETLSLGPSLSFVRDGDRRVQRLLRGRQPCISMEAVGEWNQLQVVSNVKASETHHRLLLSGGACYDTYKVPGQYVKIRKDSTMEKPGFFAMANAPGGQDKLFEFLIKRTEGSSWICDATEGAVLDVSPSQGKGFPYANLGADVKEIILLATGSGIAPIKAVLESNQLKSRTVRLYYGAQTPSRMAYQELFPAWSKLATSLVPVISRPESTGWTGRAGYIQRCLFEDGLSRPAETAVLLCGVNPMVKEAKEQLLAAGVPAANILLNF